MKRQLIYKVPLTIQPPKGRSRIDNQPGMTETDAYNVHGATRYLRERLSSGKSSP